MEGVQIGLVSRTRDEIVGVDTFNCGAKTHDVLVSTNLKDLTDGCSPPPPIAQVGRVVLREFQYSSHLANNGDELSRFASAIHLVRLLATPLRSDHGGQLREVSRQHLLVCAVGYRIRGHRSSRQWLLR